MKNKDIKEIRKIFIEELINYEGKPILFDKISRHVLDKIIFDYHTEGNEVYKTISKEILDIASKIDFLNVSFDNADVQSMDFENFHNVRINPQTVYKKDLSYGYFKNVRFIGRFDNVDIECATFENNKGLYINPETIKDKNMSGASLNSAVITGGFKGVDITHVDFAGSTSAIIDVSKIKNRDLSFVKLKDAYVKGTFREVELYGTDFRGAKSLYGDYIKINPQVVKDKTIYICILEGVEFTGLFDGVTCVANNFAGSKGAIINPQNIIDKQLKKCTFCDVLFEGSFDDCDINGSNFICSDGAQIDLSKIKKITDNSTILFDVTIVEDKCKKKGEYKEKNFDK